MNRRGLFDITDGRLGSSGRSSAERHIDIPDVDAVAVRSL